MTLSLLNGSYFVIISILLYNGRMLDIKFIRENKDIVQAGAKKKHIDVDIDALIALDDMRLKQLKEIEDLRAEVNRVSNDIVRKQEPALKAQLIEEMRIVKDDIKKNEQK
jgi:seryl-tRNA synthetase